MSRMLSTGRRAALVLFAVVALLLLVAPGARAANQPGILDKVQTPDSLCDYIAGSTLCDAAGIGPAKAPEPVRPDSGVGGLFSREPAVAPTGDPFAEGSTVSLYDVSGLAGFGTTNYDGGSLLSSDPIAVIGNTGENATANTLVDLGLGLTGLTTVIGDVVYDPSIAGDILADFAHDVTEAIRVGVWVPFIGVGLIAAGLIALAIFGRVGDLHGSWSAALSAILVLGVGLIVIAYPVAPAQKLQQATTSLTQVLNGGAVVQDDPTGQGGPSFVLAPGSANARATDAIVRGVHYNGYLRRSLGNNEACATKYGPTLYQAQRYTWAEMKQADSSTAVREALDARKAKEFTEAAEAMKKEYPSCYRALQGGTSRTTMGVIELGASASANAFRLAAYVLLVAGMVYLVLIGIAALAMAPYLLTEPARSTRRGMLDAAVRAAGYAFLAAIYSWAFSLYASFVMRPGIDQWLSLVLIFIGTIGFWNLLAPHRKLLSFFRPSRFDGASPALRWMLGKVVDHASRAWVGGKAAEEVVKATTEPVRSEAYAAPPLPSTPALPAGTPLETGRPELPVGDGRTIRGDVVDAPEYRRLDEDARPMGNADFAVDARGEVYTRKADQS